MLDQNDGTTILINAATGGYAHVAKLQNELNADVSYAKKMDLAEFRQR